MKIEFLKRLFTSCSDEAGDYYQGGLNLCELYKRIEEVEVAQQRFDKAMDELSMDPDTRGEITEKSYDLEFAREMQGFINGFRLCAQMGKEMGGKEVQA